MKSVTLYGERIMKCNHGGFGLRAVVVETAGGLILLMLLFPADVRPTQHGPTESKSARTNVLEPPTRGIRR